MKSVAESEINPLLYWESNFAASLNLVRVMTEFDCNIMVFSSSATVYGTSNNSPVNENDLVKPLNTYGNTKYAIEILLKDVFRSLNNKFKVANLRYFNPIGAHPSGFIGEDPNGIPNNIFPVITQVALGKIEKLKIFGNDWPTFDGTGIRDYIHVMDLADGHIKTLEYLLENDSQFINLNLGTGVGTSVLELIGIFESTNKVKIPHVFCKRRPGDVSELIADNSLAKKF